MREAAVAPCRFLLARSRLQPPHGGRRLPPDTYVPVGGLLGVGFAADAPRRSLVCGRPTRGTALPDRGSGRVRQDTGPGGEETV